MAKIYTKTGDKGTTSLFGGRRVPKNDPRVISYGTVDELTSFIGVALAKTKRKQTKELLTTIQTDLYEIMAYLANAPMKLESLQSHTVMFEATIDDITKKLPELRSFILPQGGELAALLHVCRALARRCERNLVAFKRTTKSARQHEKNIVQYLNRLSDLFFTLARQAGKKEIKVKTFGN